MQAWHVLSTWRGDLSRWMRMQAQARSRALFMHVQPAMDGRRQMQSSGACPWRSLLGSTQRSCLLRCTASRAAPPGAPAKSCRFWFVSIDAVVWRVPLKVAVGQYTEVLSTQMYLCESGAAWCACQELQILIFQHEYSHVARAPGGRCWAVCKGPLHPSVLLQQPPGELLALPARADFPAAMGEVPVGLLAMLPAFNAVTSCPRSCGSAQHYCCCAVCRSQGPDAQLYETGLQLYCLRFGSVCIID